MPSFKRDTSRIASVVPQRETRVSASNFALAAIGFFVEGACAFLNRVFPLVREGGRIRTRQRRIWDSDTLSFSSGGDLRSECRQ